jgi:integral membrane protein (TIGR01906 family)
MVWLLRLASALFVVALPVFLVTTNVRFLTGEVRFYERGFRVHDADAATGLPLDELDRAAREIIDYFENDAETLRIVVDDNGEEVALFNQRETDHMEDVKALMQAVFRANEVSLAYVLAFTAGVFLWAGQGSLRKLAWLSLGGVGLGAAVVALVGVLALVGGFESTWDRFHEIAFTNDFWQLNPATDRLIQMFPEPFWAEATFIVGALTIAEALAIVIASVACIVFSRPGATPGEGLEFVRATRLRARKGIVTPPAP